MNDAKKKGKKSQLEEFQAIMGAKRNGHPSWAAEVDRAPTGWPKKTEPANTGTTNAPGKEDKRMKDKKSEEDEEGGGDGMSDMEWMRRKMQGGSGTLGDEKAFEQSDEEPEGEKAEAEVSIPNGLDTIRHH
jgi:hypothetical protein